MEQEEALNEKMSKALAVWAKRNSIRPVDFAKAMGWSYTYAWTVLNGDKPLTPSAYGQFIIAYDIDALNELFRIAGLDPAKFREDR